MSSYLSLQFKYMIFYIFMCILKTILCTSGEKLNRSFCDTSQMWLEILKSCLSFAINTTGFLLGFVYSENNTGTRWRCKLFLIQWTRTSCQGQIRKTDQVIYSAIVYRERYTGKPNNLLPPKTSDATNERKNETKYVKQNR